MRNALALPFKHSIFQHFLHRFSFTTRFRFRKRKCVLYQPYSVPSNFEFAVCALFLNRCVQLLSILTRRLTCTPGKHPVLLFSKSFRLFATESVTGRACRFVRHMHLLRLHPAYSAARYAYDALRYERSSYLIRIKIANLQDGVVTLMCWPPASFFQHELRVVSARGKKVDYHYGACLSS